MTFNDICHPEKDIPDSSWFLTVIDNHNSPPTMYKRSMEFRDKIKTTKMTTMFVSRS